MGGEVYKFGVICCYMVDKSHKDVPSLGDSKNLNTERACVFCKIVRGEISSEKILENEDFIVIKDVNPKIEGHSLIIPKEHYETILDLPPSLYKKFLGTTKEAIDKLRATNSNLVINNGRFAGQLIPHIHLHILPRKKGDGFRLNV